MSSLKVLEFTDDNVNVRGYMGQSDNIELHQVIFRHDVDSIRAGYAFSGCTNLKLFDMRNVTKVPQIDDNSFKDIPSSCKIVVPDNLYDQFVAAQYWSNMSDRIVKVSEYPYEPVRIEPYGDGKFEIWGEIPEKMISESGGVRELKVHSNAINSQNALWKIYGLKRIEFHGEDVRINSYGAVADNPDLEEVVFKHDVRYLNGAWCFSSNSKVKVYDLRNVTKVPQLRENTFQGIPSTCKIVVPDALFNDFYNNSQWGYVRNNLMKVSDYESSLRYRGLRFTSTTSGSTISMTKSNNAPDVSLLSSIDHGITWQPFVVDSTTITLNAGDELFVKAGVGGNTAFGGSAWYDYNKFVMSGSINGSGNIMSLLDGENFETMTTVS